MVLIVIQQTIWFRTVAAVLRDSSAAERMFTYINKFCGLRCVCVFYIIISCVTNNNNKHAPRMQLLAVDDGDIWYPSMGMFERDLIFESAKTQR